MKIKAVSGLALSVKSLKKTVPFYEALGFECRKQDETHAALYSNWFWIDCLVIGKDERAKLEKGGAVVTYLSVDDVDKFHKHLLSKKIKPASKPEDKPWGNREFVLRDPDGYNLVIFKRK
jgi:catechol 2,3-dioxygenase-like lactoylglutathione lyase family enzyme